MYGLRAAARLKDSRIDKLEIMVKELQQMIKQS
jgi:hypothetical protein